MAQVERFSKGVFRIHHQFSLNETSYTLKVHERFESAIDHAFDVERHLGFFHLF
jgi:hypothetical protein